MPGETPTSIKGTHFLMNSIISRGANLAACLDFRVLGGAMDGQLT